MTRPRIVTFCGSSRFVSEMAVLMWEYEKAGYITLGLHLLPMGYADCCDHLAEKQGVAAHMDELHLRKIEMADEVFVVNVGGYMGDSTKREVAYATSLAKRIVYLEDHDQVAEQAAPVGAVQQGESDRRLDKVTIYRYRDGSRIALCDRCAKMVTMGYAPGVLERTDEKIDARCYYTGWDHP